MRKSSSKADLLASGAASSRATKRASFEFLPGESSSPEAIASHNEQRQLLAGAVEETLADLSPKERAVFDARLLSDEEPTLAEVGDTLGVSRQRVQQIEKKIIGRLRAALPIAHVQQ